MKKNNKICSIFLAFGVGFVFGLPLLSYAPRSAADDFSGMLGAGHLLASTSLSGVMDEDAARAGVDFYDFETIRAFYESRDNKPLWTSDAAHVKDMVALLRDSWSHGLNPADYHLAEIERILSVPLASQASRARLELILSDAALRYGRAMTGMRIAPASIGQKAEYWRKPLTSEQVMDAVAEGKDPARALGDLAPRSKLYKSMRDELIRLVHERGDPAHGPVEFGKGLFRPGQSHKAVPALRAALRVPHDESAPAQLYDDNLAAAVMTFQRRHNLQADGILGPKTLALLNRTPEDRIRQVIANMERIRWMEPKQPSRYIIVNIPSQMLWAVEDGKVAEEMPVVVGMPSRPTQVFSTEIVGVRFNPNWTVPLSIKMKDMLPKLQQDPYALSDKGIDIIQGAGRNSMTIDPGTVDWNRISRSDMRQFRMVQAPGANNALGHFRVLMPNDYDIYLHDTNNHKVFAQEERLLSSGCVRMSDPEKIARFILTKKEGWNDEKMKTVLDRGRTADIGISERIPVYIVYQTMWFDGNGELVYGADVYGHDKKLVRALAARKAYGFPDIQVAARDTDEGHRVADATSSAREQGDGAARLASVQ